MARRRRAKVDVNVIRTEPDKKRATGNDKDDDFDAEERPVDTNVHVWRDVSTSRYVREISRRSSRTTPTDFPFLKLPIEIRNMIYRYVVVSKSPKPINLADVKAYLSGEIETAILLTSHQVYNEAVKILYDENKCVVQYARRWGTTDGISIRQDDPKTASTTARSLRNGWAVSMVKHKGLIYGHIVPRLRSIDFQVDLLSLEGSCLHVAMHEALRIYESLQNLFWLLYDTFIDQSSDTESQSTATNLGKNLMRSRCKSGWTITIRSLGTTSLPLIKRALRPLLRTAVASLIAAGDIKMVRLEGKFPKGWNKIFHRLYKLEGFNTEKLEEDDEVLNELIRPIPSFWSPELWDDDTYWDSSFSDDEE